ncbi:hypothetical protein IFM89_030311 [Coptis chinensis]|uniref:Uncharacterized protein n=1 Tax=Coptis chinensis TaxID=261450 RepID=A0A835MCQ4_9MAGN|nr:hypothetical protein IFM89_030311 [Coptis chinensis]
MFAPLVCPPDPTPTLEIEEVLNKLKTSELPATINAETMDAAFEWSSSVVQLCRGSSSIATYPAKMRPYAPSPKHITSKSGDTDSIQNAQKGLEALETRVKDLETGLEGLFKQLIHIRVAILNVFTH